MWMIGFMMVINQSVYWVFSFTYVASSYAPACWPLHRPTQLQPPCSTSIGKKRRETLEFMP